MTFRRQLVRTVAAIVVAAVALVLPGYPQSSVPESDASSAITPVATTDAVAQRRGGLDLTCEQLAPSELVTSVVGPHADPIGIDDLRAAAWNLPEAALAQDGGLICNWLSADADREWETPLSVTALPDAAEIFKRNLPALTDPLDGYSVFAEFDLFDGAVINCGGGYELVSRGPTGFEFSTRPLYSCEWHVLAEDVWLTIGLENLPVSEVTLANSNELFESITPVIEGSLSRELVDVMISNVLGSNRAPLHQPSSGLPSCAELAVAVPVELMAYDSELDVMKPADIDPSSLEVEDYIQSWFPPGGVKAFGADGWVTPALLGTYALEMWRFSFERLGFRDCAVYVSMADSESSARYLLEEMLVTRDLEWLVGPGQPAPWGERIDIEGLGVLYDFNCYVDPHCSYLFHGGDILIGFGWGGERTEIIEEARGMLDAIGASVD